MLASDVMTEEPMRITPETTVGEALTLIALATVRHLPVVADRKVVGVVSERDVLGLLSDHKPEDPVFQERKVSELMSTDLIKVAPDAGLDEVIDQLVDTGVGAILVIDGEQLRGIVSYVDVLMALKPHVPK
jgi:acetoin utilization protein AcuB